MGKKKSMVLMVLLTIVIVVLCAITAFPAFPIPGTVSKWNPAVLQYDLGADLGGGYYAYYYPEGVISEVEYENNLANKTEEEKAAYAESYLEHGSLYLDKDSDKNIVSGDQVSEEFAAEFAKLANEVSARYAAQGYSDYRVTVVDDYALRVELPASEVNAGSILTLFAYTGELTLKSGGAVIEELQSKDAKITDLVSGFSTGMKNGFAYVKVGLTKAGREMISELKDTLTTIDSANGSSSATTLDVVVGENTVLSIYQDHVDTKNTVQVYLAEEAGETYVDAVGVLLNSLLATGGFDIEFRALATSEIRIAQPIFGENTLLVIYIVLAVIIAALIVVSILKMGRFGGMSAYTALSYFIITALCFAFITEGVFEITLGSVLIFLVGLILVNVLNAHIYNAIKAEFSLGKTVESSVKGGYKKTLFGIVDIYAVLLLGSIALLIGVAGLYTLALQALICIVTAAFCNLLWGRAINFVYLSASKNKYKYFRFVREDDDDE